MDRVTEGSRSHLLRSMPKLAITVVMAAAAMIIIIPVLLTLTNSLMTEQEIGLNYDLIGVMSDAAKGGKDAFVNLKWVPDWLSFEQYAQVLIFAPKFLHMFWNSVALVLPIIAGQIVVSSLAAYAFAKLRFMGRNKLFMVYLMTMLMPFQVTLVPNYLVIDTLGLLNREAAIILPGIFSAFGVFMMRQFMAHIRPPIPKRPKWTAPATGSFFCASSCRWRSRDWRL